MSELGQREFERLPLETQVAVLYERVANLSGDVKSIKTALWSVAVAIVGAVFTFALAIASGVIGGG